MLAAIGVAFAVCLSDAFAFGALARAEALVPGGVLFVFIAALGADRLRVDLSVALVGAGVIATVILRAHHAPGGIRSAHHARRRLLWQALATATVIALLAGYVGQRLPGAREEALFDTRGNGDGDGAESEPTRRHPQPAHQPATVRPTGGHLDRRVVLARDRRCPSSTVPRGGPPTARSANPTPSPSSRDRQRSSCANRSGSSGLAGTMVPVAPDAIQAEGPDTVRYDFGTATLSADEEFSNGDSFVAVSAAPTYTPEALAAATSDDPGDPIYLELPDDFPESAAQLAEAVTAGATNNYETALALQNWFKAEFTYSLEVQPGPRQRRHGGVPP